MKTRIKIERNGVADLYKLDCVRNIGKNGINGSLVVGIMVDSGDGGKNYVYAFEGDEIVVDDGKAFIERA